MALDDIFGNIFSPDGLVGTTPIYPTPGKMPTGGLSPGILDVFGGIPEPSKLGGGVLGTLGNIWSGLGPFGQAGAIGGLGEILSSIFSNETDPLELERLRQEAQRQQLLMQLQGGAANDALQARLGLLTSQRNRDDQGRQFAANFTIGGHQFDAPERALQYANKMALMQHSAPMQFSKPEGRAQVFAPDYGMSTPQQSGGLDVAGYRSAVAPFIAAGPNLATQSAQAASQFGNVYGSPSTWGFGPQANLDAQLKATQIQNLRDRQARDSQESDLVEKALLDQQQFISGLGSETAQPASQSQFAQTRKSLEQEALQRALASLYGRG